MLSMFEVSDLPRSQAVRVPETMALCDVERLASEQPGCVVVVMEGFGRTLGIVEIGTIRDMARYAPEAPVGMHATMTVVEVPPTMCLVDAVRAVSEPGVGALLVQDGEASIIAREALLAFDSWPTLLTARMARLAKVLDLQQSVQGA